MRLREVAQVASGYAAGEVRPGWSLGLPTLSPVIAPS